MSTIKVNSIKNTSTDDGGIAIDNSGHVQVDGVQLPTAGALSNRNLIINGAMQVAQRGTSFDQGSSSTYNLDRFLIRIGSSFNADSTVTQDSSGPTGFTNSLKITPDSIQTPSGSHNAAIAQIVEAQSLQHLAYNTSAAVKTTVSFYVKSNKTGTYCFQVYNQDALRIYMREYTISASDTWEYKTITIPGDTSGVINNDNGGGLFFYWHLASGSSDHASEDTAWRSSALFQTTSNQVNFFDSTSNEFYLTGVQLEVGEKATPFEHRSYGDELQRCLRYYEQSNPTLSGSDGKQPFVASTGSDFLQGPTFKVTKRAAPTMAGHDGISEMDGSGTSLTIGSFQHIGINGALRLSLGGSGRTNAQVYRYHWSADAEL